MEKFVALDGWNIEAVRETLKNLSELDNLMVLLHKARIDR
jgi:hypothetical protein